MAGSKAKSGHKQNMARKRHRELYRERDALHKNKLKRIAKSNGHKAAVDYASKHMLIDWGKRMGIL